MTDRRELPRISIVTTCLNQVDLIGQALSSVLDQDYQNLEYIVIDGGSTDGSTAIIEEVADRLAYWVSEPDAGHYNALNKGFEKSTGEIMGFLNGDDVLLPGSLALIAHIFSQFPDVEWVTGAHVAIDPVGRPAKLTPAGRWSRRHLLSPHSGRMVPQESTFWHRRLWHSAGGRLDEVFSLAADFDLWVRFSREADLHSIYAPIGCFRFTKDQRSVRRKADYESEVNAVRKRELGASRADRWATRAASGLFLLLRAVMFTRGLGIGRLRSLVDSLLGAPPAIYFDQVSHKFVRAAERPSFFARRKTGAMTG